MKKEKLFTLFIMAVLIFGLFTSLMPQFNVRFETVKAAGDFYADTGSAEDIQYAVDTAEAAGGGTVHVPSGTFDWYNDQVSVTSDNITIMGEGIGVTYINQTKTAPFSDMFVITGCDNFRITAMTVHGLVLAEGSPYSSVFIQITNCRDYRVDHCYTADFAEAAIQIRSSSPSRCYGVIDHCTITNPYKNIIGGSWAEGISLKSTNEASPSAWHDDITDFLGQYPIDLTHPQAYIEDCVTYQTRHAITTQALGWYVIRHNTFYQNNSNNIIDIHGGWDSIVGGRGLECYDNVIDHQDTGGWGIALRGGAGVIYNNTIQNVYTGIRLTRDDVTDPKPLKDVWIWDNTFSNVNVNFDVSPSGYYTEDVDYFLRVPNQGGDGFTYTSYTYPHPLTEEQIGISVTLNSPADESSQSGLPTTFTYTPISIGDSIYNASVWTNTTGTWALTQSNTTTVLNNAVNSIDYTFSSYGTYKWNIQVFNSTTNVFASSNWTLTFPTPSSIVSSSENQYVTSGNSQQKVVRTSTGTLYCTYYKYSGIHWQVYVSTSGDNGETWVDEILISKLTSMENHHNYFPSIAIDSNNYVLIVWQGASSDYSSTQIWYSKYTGTWSSPIRLSTYSGMSTTQQSSPAVAVDSNDYLYVTWYGYATGYSYKQIWVVDYINSWSEPVRISTYSGMDSATQLFPCVAIDSLDYVDILWRGAAPITYNYSEIWFAQYNRTAWSAPLVVSTYAGMNDTAQISPGLAIDSNDNIYAAWHGEATGYDYMQIWIAKYDGTWQIPVKISTYAGMDEYDQEDPAISIDTSGNIHIMWFGRATGYTDYDKVWYAYYDNTWNTPECLQATGRNTYPTILWSNYPSFNIPTDRLEYVFTEGTGSPYNVTFGYFEITIESWWGNFPGEFWGGWWIIPILAGALYEILKKLKNPILQISVLVIIEDLGLRIFPIAICLVFIPWFPLWGIFIISIVFDAVLHSINKKSELLKRFGLATIYNSMWYGVYCTGSLAHPILGFTFGILVHISIDIFWYKKNLGDK